MSVSLLMIEQGKSESETYDNGIQEWQVAQLVTFQLGSGFFRGGSTSFVYLFTKTSLVVGVACEDVESPHECGRGLQKTREFKSRL